MQKHDDLFVVVETYDMSGSFVSKVIIDYRVDVNRRWLARHVRWAYHNSFKITTYRTHVQPTFDVRKTDAYKQRRNME